MTIWVLLMAMAVPAGSAPTPEVRARKINESKVLVVKAAYLYNFAKFIEWPGHALGEREAPLVIGVLDDEPFARILGATVRGGTVANRAVEVRRLSWAKKENRAKLSECHAVYIGHAVRDRLGEILAALDERPVLAVSDISGFAGTGGMIGFPLYPKRWFTIGLARTTL